MKKTILAIATLAILTVGNGFAQNAYYSKGHKVPAVVEARTNSFDGYNVNQLDNIVSLSNKQEKAIKKIEKKYDKIASNNRRPQTLQNLKSLEMQKQREILLVLTPAQRQRLVAFQHAEKFDNHNRFNRRG